MKRVAIYARVSTTDQNCEMQLRELRDYCRRRKWKITAEYVDTGYSGMKKQRPALDRCMEDAKMARFEAVLVWKLDRWGRSLIHLHQSIAALTGYGVAWMAITQGLDTSNGSPTANLLLNILGSVAEFEREIIRERVKAGMNAAKHRGMQLGRRPVVFDRQKARDLHSKGKSIRHIATALKVSIGTIHGLFNNGSVRTPRK